MKGPEEMVMKNPKGSPKKSSFFKLGARNFHFLKDKKDFHGGFFWKVPFSEICKVFSWFPFSKYKKSILLRKYNTILLILELVCVCLLFFWKAIFALDFIFFTNLSFRFVPVLSWSFL